MRKSPITTSKAIHERAPIRVQRRRTKGWTVPVDERGQPAIYVGRGTKWGNPYRVGECPSQVLPGFVVQIQTVEDAVRCYEAWVGLQLQSDPEFLAPLRGRDLMCWCPLHDPNGRAAPCHADVLLDLANAPPPKAPRRRRREP